MMVAPTLCLLFGLLIMKQKPSWVFAPQRPVNVPADSFYSDSFIGGQWYHFLPTDDQRKFILKVFGAPSGELLFESELTEAPLKSRKCKLSEEEAPLNTSIIRSIGFEKDSGTFRYPIRYTYEIIKTADARWCLYVSKIVFFSPSLPADRRQEISDLMKRNSDYYSLPNP